MAQISAPQHLPVRNYGSVKNLIKTPYYSPWFSAKNGKSSLRLKMIPPERASQEEYNGTISAPSSEELHVSVWNDKPMESNHRLLCERSL